MPLKENHMMTMVSQAISKINKMSIIKAVPVRVASTLSVGVLVALLVVVSSSTVRKMNRLLKTSGRVLMNSSEVKPIEIPKRVGKEKMLL
jgi:hypothetical protein